MENYLKFCEEYGFDKKNSRSLNIYHNFNKFKDKIAEQRELIKNQTVLDYYNTVR